MNSIRKGATLSILAAATMLGGCATKSFVREQVSALEQRQNTQITALGQRVDTADQTANDALSRAEAAGKLAQGKFDYSVVLSDEQTKFASDMSNLSPEAKTILADLAKKLIAQNENVYLEIQGYTDSAGSADYNLRLGQARADAAMRFLHEQGIAANRMATISFGEAHPMAPNTTAQGRAANRRITIVVLK